MNKYHTFVFRETVLYFAIFHKWKKAVFAGIQNMFLQVDMRTKRYTYIFSTTWECILWNHVEGRKQLGLIIM